MNLLERVFTLLRANLNTVVEKAEDPERVLRQLQLDMRNQLVQVKTQVATAIAEGHRLQKRSQERKGEADKWLHQAEQAVQQGSDDSAREALGRYNDVNRQIQRYQQQKKEQDQLVVTMRTALRQLEAKITEVDTTIDLLASRRRNALLQQRVFDALNKSGNIKDRERARGAQDAIQEAEARARALADLHNRDMDTQLEQLSAAQEVEGQLQAIKTKQQAQQEPPLLHSGQPRTSPLLRPQPAPGEPVKRRQDAVRQAEIPTDPSTSKDIDLEHLKKLLDVPQSLE